MKSILILGLALMGSSAFAAPHCYVANNFEAMSVEIHPEDAPEATVEAVVKADLKLYSNEDGTRLADMNVVTESGKKIRVGAFYSSGDRAKSEEIKTYYVECDGGSMDIQKLETGSALVSSERIRGDIEGCDGFAEVKTAGTEFIGVDCPQIE